jgi:hypothetical protein
VRGDLEGTSRVWAESEVELALVLAVGRRRGAPAVGESPEVERRETDCVRGVRDELDWRSVEADPESEVFDPLGYGDGMDIERISWPTVMAETGVRGLSSPGSEISRKEAGGPGVEIVRRLASFDITRGWVSERAISGIFSVLSKPTRGEGGRRLVRERRSASSSVLPVACLAVGPLAPLPWETT